MGIPIRPLGFNELTSGQRLENYASDVIPCLSLQCTKIIVVFSPNGEKAKNSVHIMRNVIVGFASWVDHTENQIFTVLMFTLYFESGGAVRKIKK